jgi:hypothetical protein
LKVRGDIRGGQGSVTERIIGEALRWPGVYCAKGHFGSVELRVGRRELGHLHADAVADVPLPSELMDQRLKDGVGVDNERQHDSGWVAVALETEEDVQDALALLRGNYERAQAE